ncbi:serine hydrolase [Gramella sp. MAR_2010_147]|uniref:serine hydrolase domain-containing protein n=1 Tax=Gramella sp. MAR_2010_147 TaxID=1250205 RepID=UPI00087CF217|nr:serine hydrolase [Gramella sp. MAR_2010_147]SDS40586.1 CubicO group peptidase, beta-lactamase class C family [Gramella sp. MAR_2010_147]
MKKLLKAILFFIGFLIFASLILYILGFGYIFKAVNTTYLTGHKTAFIDDHPYFDNHVIQNSENIQEWAFAEAYNQTEATSTLDSLHNELETAAFLIIKKDSIWFEKYYNGYNEKSKTNSFSMAKSLVTALMFKAIQDGHLENINQPVGDFFPQFDKELTIGDLASMSSGLNWNENYYNPFASTARAYFDENIREQILELEVIEKPGKEFKYLSGNTQLLGMVLEKATGKSLSNYLSESFWKPLGMNDDALWQLDSEASGMEKAYCCISSNARNFAKFGKLFINNGTWNGKQLLDSAYIAKASIPRFKTTPYYGYGFWLSDHLDKEIFYMRGVLGQYVIIVPEDDLVIVRLGRKLIRSTNGDKHYKDFYMYIDEAYKMLDDAS